MAISLTEDLTNDGRLLLGATSGPPDRWAHATAAEQPVAHGDRGGTKTWKMTILPVDEPDLCSEPASQVIDRMAELGGGRVHWWTEPMDLDHMPDRYDGGDALLRDSNGRSGSGDALLAAALGMEATRELYELAVELPMEARLIPFDQWVTRPLDPERDLSSLCEVNNAAFEWHPDQAGWSLRQFELLIQSGEMIPEDVLVIGESASLRGFCWTKPHSHREPPEGEIFVIGVHPDFQGQGLGRLLTTLGLHHLHVTHGANIGTLFVESTNTSARRLYADMGFVHRRTMRCWEMTVPGAG